MIQHCLESFWVNEKSIRTVTSTYVSAATQIIFRESGTRSSHDATNITSRFIELRSPLIHCFIRAYHGFVVRATSLGVTSRVSSVGTVVTLLTSELAPEPRAGFSTTDLFRSIAIMYCVGSTSRSTGAVDQRSIHLLTRRTIQVLLKKYIG